MSRPVDDDRGKEERATRKRGREWQGESGESGRQSAIGRRTDIKRQESVIHPVGLCDGTADQQPYLVDARQCVGLLVIWSGLPLRAVDDAP